MKPFYAVYRCKKHHCLMEDVVSNESVFMGLMCPECGDIVELPLREVLV